MSGNFAQRPPLSLNSGRDLRKAKNVGVRSYVRLYRLAYTNAVCGSYPCCIIARQHAGSATVIRGVDPGWVGVLSPENTQEGSECVLTSPKNVNLSLPARRRPQGLVVIGVCLSVCLCVCLCALCLSARYLKNGFMDHHQIWWVGPGG